MFLEGRPPINFGVTNSGDLLGGTQITFTDVLGDQQFSVLAYSISQYRTLGASYANLSGRFQFAVQGFSSEQFFFGYVPGSTFASSLSFLSRDDALATRTTRGGSVFGIYPFDRFRRVEFSAGLFNTNESFANDTLAAQSDAFQQSQFGTSIFRSGTFAPLGVRYIRRPPSSASTDRSRATRSWSATNTRRPPGASCRGRR